MDVSIPEIIQNAWLEFIKSDIIKPCSFVPFVLINDMATAAPSNSNTIEIVVDVGIP